MPKAVTLLLSAVALALAAPAAAQPPEKQRLSVINTTERVAFCTFLFDGKARTNLAIRPGKTWFEDFDPRRHLQLVCQRGKTNAFGPLEAGKSYRLVVDGSKMDLAEGAGE